MLPGLLDWSRKTVSPALDAVGLLDPLVRRTAATGWTVLFYHRVIDDPADDPFSLGMCVSVAHFEEQLRYLRSAFHPIALGDAVRRLASGEPLPRASVSITIDDGYRDTLTNALPILERHGIPATLYVPTGRLDDGEPFWWDRVIAAFDVTTGAALDAAAIGLDAALGSALVRWTAATKSGVVERVLRALWTLPPGGLPATVCALERQLAPRGSGPVRAVRLRPAEVVELHRRGVEIGAHTVRHVNLQRLEAHEVLDELVRSHATLEAILDAPVASFAYPSGYTNPQVRRLVREAGFRDAVSTVPGVNADGADRWMVRRFGMPNQPLADVKRAYVHAAALAPRLREEDG